MFRAFRPEYQERSPSCFVFSDTMFTLRPSSPGSFDLDVRPAMCVAVVADDDLPVDLLLQGLYVRDYPDELCQLLDDVISMPSSNHLAKRESIISAK